MRSGGAPTHTLTTFELVAMVAALSALNALSIDIMLPALPDIGRAFGLVNDNDRQLVVIVYVAAFGVMQLVYGPLSDAFGRRSVLVGALGLFVIGGVLCVVAPSFEIFLAARALQGVGAAATRVISVAVVRDLVEGRRMAQIMSMAMTVFMLVPIIAPGVGQLILLVAPWRWIFGALLIYTLALLAWALIRLPETLKPENTTPFRPRAIASAYASVLHNRQFVGYMIASIFLSGGLFGYITASEQLYVDVFDLGHNFAFAFAAIAIAITIGTFLNSRIVMRYGMRRISHAMALAFTALAAIHTLMELAGLVSIWVFLPMLALTLMPFGMIGGNFNALAMEPMGRNAGSASALFGATTAVFGAALGGLIARAFNGTALPFLIGFTIMGVLMLLSVFWVERGKLFAEPSP
ncbi:MFS family multidrug efflux protein [alpha proteobacterium U9-1i]|nr:MFS family multidrug efflux protein [alpha proteobacterium U9-1i]